MVWRIIRNLVAVMLIVGTPLAYTQSPRAEDTDDKPDLQPQDLGKTWVKIDDDVYGAVPSEDGPIGGGDGYRHIVTSGDYTVTGGYLAGSIDQLIEALSNARPGEVVFLNSDVQLDLSVRIHVEDFVLKIPAGVTVASDRGHNGSAGAIIFSDSFRANPMIEMGRGARLVGLRVRGPDTRHRTEELARLGKKGISHYKWPTTVGILVNVPDVEVSNCELFGWSYGAVMLKDKAARVHTHHCYYHHNQRRSLGYGVVLYHGQALIEYCLFDYHRHAIAASGHPTEGYEARHNVVLEHASGGGAHAFDMHGGRDRKDGTQIAGNWVKIHHNQFRLTHEEAVRIRGVPKTGAEIHHNWFFHENPGGRVIDSGGKTDVHSNVYGAESPTVKDDSEVSKR